MRVRVWGIARGSRHEPWQIAKRLHPNAEAHDAAKVFALQENGNSLQTSDAERRS